MKKTIFALAFLAVAMISCQDKTKDKIDDATEAIGSEMEQKTDTISENIENEINTIHTEAGEMLNKGAIKLDEEATDLKEEMHN